MEFEALVRRTWIRPRLALAAALVAGFCLPLLGGSAAHADPQADVSDAQARLTALQNQAEAITEQWHKSQIALTSAKAAQQSAQQALVRSQAAVAAQRSRVAAAAAATYKAGALGQVAIFVGSADPQAFLDRAADLGQVAHGRSADIALLSSVVKQQSDAQAVVDHATKVADGAAKTADDNKAAIEASVAQQRSVLNDALAKQAEVVRAAQEAAARADAAHKAAALAAQQAAIDAQTALQRTQAATQTPIVDDTAAAAPVSTVPAGSAGPDPSADPDPVAAGPVRSGSGVAAVIAAAQAQLGKPYVYGAAGPSAFDCSGLTMWAYQAAGVSLPHYTGAQAQMGRHIPLSQLQPGDLVFFYGDLHHVGLYVGGGQMIDAPHTGAWVEQVGLFPGAQFGVRIFG